MVGGPSWPRGNREYDDTPIRMPYLLNIHSESNRLEQPLLAFHYILKCNGTND